MSIKADSILLEPGSEVSFLKIDATVIHPSAGILYAHNHNHGVIRWQGVDYSPWPYETEGFEKSGDKPPSPTLAAANVDQALTAMCLQYDDLVGAIVTRKRTLVKYLDASNFPGGNPTANPNEFFPDEVWYIDRKEHEDSTLVRWSLASALDFNGIRLPGRVVVANRCAWLYRSAECGYAGPPVAKYDDTPTTDPALDSCSRSVTGCKLRYGEHGELPYGSFPSVRRG